MNKVSNFIGTLVIAIFALAFLSLIDTLLFNFKDLTMTVIAWLILISVINYFFACFHVPLRTIIWILLFLPAVYLFWLAHDYGNFYLDDAKLAIYGRWYWINVILWSIYTFLSWILSVASDTNWVGDLLWDLIFEKTERELPGYNKDSEDINFFKNLASKEIWSLFYTVYFSLSALIIFNGFYVYLYWD
tara:strand:+ start:459 stop:1025 length:567 start_codon:yes stop_codon:yes gene_type:complete